MYDCGMYTILYAEAILQQMTVGKIQKLDDINFAHLTPEYVTKMRSDIRGTIDKLRATSKIYSDDNNIE